MIRTQQLQLEQMRQYQQDHNARHQSSAATLTSGAPVPAGTGGNTAVVDDSTPTSERSFSIPNPLPFFPVSQAGPRATRRNSRPGAGSSATSPALRPLPIHTQHETSTSSHGSADWPPSPVEIARRNSSRDENAYYQAETATLTRENQMLRLRIRELERQVNEMNSNAGTVHVSPTAPITSSNLNLLVMTGREGVDTEHSNSGPTEINKD